MTPDKKYKKVYLNEAGMGWWSPQIMDFDTPVGYTINDEPIFEDKFGRKFTLEEDVDEHDGTTE